MAIDQSTIRRNLAYIERNMYRENKTQEEKEKLERMALFCVRNSLPDNNRANIILGRLYYQQGDYSESRIQFNYAKNKNPNKPSVYYGLYKNDVMEGNWQEALDNLNIYLEMVENDKRIDGFNIIIALLNYLTNQNANLEIPLDIYLSQEIKDKKLEGMYEELVDDIVQGAYLKALALARSCEEYSRSINNFLEFRTLENILLAVQRKYKTEQAKNIQMSADLAFERGNYDDLYSYLAIDIYNKIHRLDYAHYIPVLIENGYHKEVKELLDQVEFKGGNSKSKPIYRKMIREKELFDMFDDEQKEYYEQAIEAIENAILARNYVDVYDMASAACYKLEHPIFLYYIGLALFFCEEYYAAHQYFVGYNRRGGSKALESRYFIACCHKNLDQRKQFKERKRNYRRYCYSLNKKYCNDFLKYSYEPVQVKPHCNYEEVGKITNNEDYLKIKELLMFGKTKEANKRIEELLRQRDKSPEDKKVLDYIMANKKIHRNQKK